MTGSLRAVLTHLIDYAGLYPPASLPLPEVLVNYRRYLASPESWILNRLVLPQAKLAEAGIEPHWRITLLTDSEPGPLPPQVETLETKSPHRFTLPTYSEAPGAPLAKIRLGEAVPSSEHITDFLMRRVPFKATAGLHHPIRADMHGFVNVFVAAALAWHGADRDTLIQVLDERDARAFTFGEDALRWRGHVLTTAELAATRRDFAHGFGSCSFEEPIAELRALGWLP
jgi:hypothetical protein